MIIRDATKSFPFLLAVLVALLAAGCVARNDPEAQATATAEMVAAVQAQRELAGTAWDVAYFFEPDEQVALVPGTRLTTNFLADRYAGSSGCNWYLGVFSADAGTLLLYPPAQTQVICADEGVNQQEALFTSTMANTIAYAFEGDQLVAYTSDNQRLITYNPAEPVPFEGTQWSVKFLAEEDEAISVAPGTEVTARFDAGRLTGSGGCNEYEAAYSADANGAMTISEIVPGSSVCSEPANVMEQETFFLQTLPTVVAYEQIGGMLLLFDEAGGPAVILGAP